MDALSRLLRTVHIDGMNIERLETQGSWGTPVPRYSCSTSILLVIRVGELWIEALDPPSSPRCWTAGESVLLLPGYRLTARTAPDAHVRPLETLSINVDSRGIHWGRGGAPTCLTALHCSVPEQSLTPFADALSPMVGVGEGTAVSREVVWALIEQHESGRPGAHAALERMAELVLIDAISEQVRRQGALPGPHVDEPKIARALMLIHAQPSDPWTLTSLARRVGMSRTVFATQFATHVGESPIRYLTRTRIEQAEHLLATTSEPLAAIARRVGYREVTAFCRAFKRLRGRTPATARDRPWSGDERADPAPAVGRRD